MKKIFLIITSLLFITCNIIHAAEQSNKEEAITLPTSTGDIKGIIREPATNETKSIAIIISGAARTDRDGNQPQTKNNSLKMLAEALVEQDIAVLNFDKRGVGQSQRAGASEAKITLNTYVDDVKAWIELLKTEKEFDNIIVVGHGEGALIGMLATIDNPQVDKLITIGATSKKASEITRAQFADQSAGVKKMVFANLDKLERGEKIEHVATEWSILFRSSLQPYLISLYKHTPTEEIAKVDIPTLIIQGDKDVQATVDDAEQLTNACAKTQKVVIENMNYVLKECTKDGHQNQLDTYLRPNYPLNKELVPTITKFILEEEA